MRLAGGRWSISCRTVDAGTAALLPPLNRLWLNDTPQEGHRPLHDVMVRGDETANRVVAKARTGNATMNGREGDVEERITTTTLVEENDVVEDERRRRWEV